jgi:DNA-directed RNA polymerase beta subunit/DNA-directed RNA polymerase beta' subunit
MSVYIDLKNTLRSFIENCGTSTEFYSVTYDLIDSVETPESSSTVYLPVSVMVKIRNLITGQWQKMPVSVLHVPAETYLGYKINGTFYSMMGVDKRAPGWCLTKSNKHLIMEMIPSHGSKLTMAGSYGEIFIKIGSNKRKINGGVFLKALTGKSFDELALKLGMKNRYIISTLIEEPSREECIRAVLEAIREGKGGGKSSSNNLGAEFQYKELMRRFYSKKMMNIGASRTRIEREMSFLSRALHKELARDILSYKSGTTLTEEILKDIDSSGIDTLMVYYNSKVYELKKYPLVDEEDLSENELFTIFNMFALTLDGYPSMDERYELYNRKIVTYKDTVLETIKNNLFIINNYVSNAFISGGIETDVSLIDIPTLDIESLISKIKEDPVMSQPSETTNIVSVLAKNSKIASDYSGRSNDGLITVKSSEYGIYDPFHQPESKKIGRVHYRTLMSEEAEDGTIRSKFMKVENCKVLGEEPVLLESYEILNSYIGAWNCDLSSDLVSCHYNGRIIKVHPSKLQYIEYSNLNNLSLPSALIPMGEFQAGKRTTMSDGQRKQAVITLRAERPIFSTGVISLLQPGIETAKDILSLYYINNSNIVSHIEFENFINRPIKLVSTVTSEPGYRKLIFELDLGRDEETLTVERILPFCRRTTDDSLTQYNIRPTRNLVYQGDDIVAYDNSLDIRKYDVDKYLETGHMKVDPNNDFCVDLATGVNLKVGVKTWMSSCLDDGMTISGGLLGTNKLAHIYIKEIRYELKKSEDENSNEVETFGCLSYIPDFTKEGLPQVGTYLKPKSVVIAKYVKGEVGIKDSSIKLDVVTEGEVILATLSNNDTIATVYIATIKEIDVGDKMTGDYGNKGVVAKIVPESHMPYIQSTGEPLDLEINPLGVPSRMNVAQFYHALIAFAATKLGADKRVVLSPYHPDSKEIVAKYTELTDTKPEYLVDGRTGALFDRPTTVGVMYYQKLKHLSSSKSASTNLITNISTTTLQPVKGKKRGGGQSFGEMETWAFISAGCTRGLQEIMSVLSDDLVSKKFIVNRSKGGDREFDGSIVDNAENHNDAYALAISRMLGTDIVNDEENGGYKMKILTDSDICSFAERPIENNKESLHDHLIFGTTDDPNKLFKVRQRWGYMELKCEIIHPTWIYKSRLGKLLIARVLKEKSKGEYVLNKPEPLNARFLRDIILGKAYVDVSGENAIVTKLTNISELRDIKGYEFKSGMPSVVHLFKVCKLEDSYNFYSSSIAKMKESREHWGDDIYKEEQLYSMIEMLKKEEMEFKDFIISHFPILPRTYRLSMMNRVSDFDLYYRRIINSVKVNNINKSTEIFNSIAGFIGYDESHEYGKEKKVRTILTYFTGKRAENSDGAIRDNAMTKIISRSFRGTIVPAEAGLITLEQAGIPFSYCVNCLSDFIKPKLTKAYTILENGSRSDDNVSALLDAIVTEDYAKVGGLLCLGSIEESKSHLRLITEMLIEYIESKVIILGRQPTLHRLGCRAFKVKVVKGQAIQLHPLTCDAYNADFDGDQMYGAFPLDPETEAELLEKISTYSEMLNTKDDSFILIPKQDILLGIYLSTMLHENKTWYKDTEKYSENNIVLYDNLETLDSDILYKNIERYDLICYKHSNGEKYLSTAGRILFNSLLPDGFTNNEFTNPLGLDFIDKTNYKNLAFDGLIKKNKDPKGKVDKETGRVPLQTFSMQEICYYLMEKCSNKKVCEYLDKMLIFGVSACDRSGITLHPDDYIEHPEIDSMISKSEAIVKEINDFFELGLITDEDRKTSSFKIYKYMTDYIKKGLLSYYDRNNNLFIIMDSGARGNLSQLMQSCGIIGIVSRSNNDELETPILSNYSRGLSSFDQILISYGTRVGFSKVQNDTADAGELTRSSVFTTSNFKIVEHDCGKLDNLIDVRYSTELLSVKKDGQDIDIADLIGKTIHSSDENLQKYMSISGNIVDSLVIYYIRKAKIRKVILDDGIVNIKYKLDPLFKGLILNRVGYDLPYLENSIVSNKTIKEIESNNLTKVNIRLMLDCNSIGGVCAKCYGVKAERHKYPRVGEEIGISASQSIGETATQLNLDSVNNGGKSDSSSSGVETFKAYIKGSFPKRQRTAITAYHSGFFRVKDMGKEDCMIYNLNGKSDDKYKVPKDAVIIQDGEYVERGQFLTNGVIDVNSVKRNDSSQESIKERQIALLQVFYDMFSTNNITISVRNFEVIVRVQTSLVRVTESNDERYESGGSYFLQEILKDNADVTYYQKTEKTEDVVNKLGGFLSNLAYTNVAGNIADIALIPDRQRSKRMGALSQMMIGENTHTKATKRINTPKYINKISSLKEIALEGEVANSSTSSILSNNELDFNNLENLNNFESLNFDLFDNLEGEESKLEESSAFTNITADEELIIEEDNNNINPQEDLERDYNKVRESSSF